MSAFRNIALLTLLFLFGFFGTSDLVSADSEDDRSIGVLSSAESDSHTDLIEDFLSQFSEDEAEILKRVCANLESHEACSKYDEGVDSTYGLEPLNLSEWVQTIYAKTFDKARDANEIQDLFETGKYFDLNEYFGVIQHRFEEGLIGEFEYNGLFHSAISQLTSNSSNKPEQFDRWVAYDKNSVYPLAARGVNYYQTGWTVRGEKIYSDVPQQNRDAMKRFMERSRNDLEAAIAANPNFMFAHQALVSTSHMAGDKNSKTLAYVNNATDVMPSAYYPRKRHMAYLLPKWGGSHLEMREFAEAVQKHIAKQPLLRFLLALEYKSRAKILMTEKKYTAALDAYAKAMHHGVDSQMLLNSYWLKYTLKKYDQAAIDADLLVKMYPSNVGYLGKRAEARYAQKEYSAGFEDYKKIVSMAPSYGRGWAGLGYYYFWIDRDFSLAEKYYAKAVQANGNDSLSRYRLAWSLIERYKPQGLTEMRSYVELCENVRCADADIAWATEWLHCIDETGKCSMNRKDYARWRFAGEIDLR